MTLYYVYSVHKDRESAKLALEDYYAQGLVCEAEQPLIKYRTVLENIKGQKYWLVLFRC